MRDEYRYKYQREENKGYPADAAQITTLLLRSLGLANIDYIVDLRRCQDDGTKQHNIGQRSGFTRSDMLWPRDLKSSANIFSNAIKLSLIWKNASSGNATGGWVLGQSRNVIS